MRPSVFSLERLSPLAQRVIVHAVHGLRELTSEGEVGTEHVLVALCEAESGGAVKAFRDLGIDQQRLRAEAMTAARSDAAGYARLLHAAWEEAQRLGHDYVGTGHLLLGVLGVAEATTRASFARAGRALDDSVRDVVAAAVRDGAGPEDGPPPPRGGHAGEAFKNAVILARDEAERLGDDNVDAEHVLLGLIQGEGIAARVLRELGATLDGVRDRIRELRDETSAR
jgi:ATP-dependent Clp protease ATP-binding subunit ClpA